MVLVDTSVWVRHFRHGEDRLAAWLHDGRVVCHPFIIGELACGHLQNRSEIIALLERLPSASLASHAEVMRFIESHAFMGQGLGYIDMHLLASAKLTQLRLWTFDQKLNKAAVNLGLAR